ncbi:MAG: cell filamentation protein Fic [Proteobacteria bacterium]|nr:MAG: cell filamentation protein Fic [Pseudomonadota bacterium]
MSIDLQQFKAGTYENGYKYQYFVPSKINDEWHWDNPQLNALIEKAAIKLGELNSFARLVPNIDLFIQLHVTKEAVVSSRIEGTRTKFDEALMPEMEIDPERRDDWHEVKNYIAALNGAIESLENLPISSRLLKQAHKTLLSGVRGKNKSPGDFRTSQNWIGASLADATFIPPADHYVEPLMGDLENFLHNDQIHIPALVRIAIAHYQFETIHPFLDGNGRIGRLMITLFLVSEKVLDRPLLYLSGFFERNKGLYYDNLTRIRTHNDMLQWLKYFLVGVEETASEAVQKLSDILRLKTELENHIQNNFGRRAANANALLHFLFKDPIVNVEQVKTTCDVSYRTANELVSTLCEHGILTEITGQNRNRLFAFSAYLAIFEPVENAE